MGNNDIYLIDNNEKIIDNIKKIENDITEKYEKGEVDDKEIVKLRFQQLMEGMKLQYVNNKINFIF